MGHNVNCSVLRNRFNCKNCPKKFMMEWAKDNHQRLCIQRDKAMENNSDSYR